MDYVNTCQITTSRQSGDCLGARGNFLIWSKITWIHGPFLCMCLSVRGEKHSKSTFFMVFGVKSIPLFSFFPIWIRLKSELIQGSDLGSGMVSDGPIWGPEGPIWGSETRNTPFFMVLVQNPCFVGEHPWNDAFGSILGSFLGGGLRGLFSGSVRTWISVCSIIGIRAKTGPLGSKTSQNLSKTSQKPLKNNDF
jgi:hypothetical protein